MNPTLIFNVLDYLTTLWKGNMPSDVVVNDGGLVTDLPDKYVFVGYTDNEDNPMIAGAQQLANSGNNFTDESTIIWNQISVADGNSEADLKNLRNQAVNYMGICFDTVKADKTLGQTLPQGSFAWPSQFTVKQAEMSKGGVAVIVDFVIALEVHSWVG